VKLWIFRGPSQKKYDAEFAEALLPLGARVAIVKCEKSGRNALDMHIAFQMGRLVGELARDGKPQQASFIASGDTGGDPLLAYVMYGRRV
ncbi:MAG: PIN domain-containing protein, partial [Sutterellaceae bacterium]|nr:PIN domain-containing protein [Burkholderiaceae bacterium]MDW8430285.1 PIN domain-containing protein [Sutterellaceae bacterium]